MHVIHGKGDELFWDAIIIMKRRRKKNKNNGKNEPNGLFKKRMENKNENYSRNLSYEFICLLFFFFRSYCLLLRIRST